jgi:predicted aspartyl protease
MLKGRNKKADIKALVDCGASTLFISERFVKEKQVRTRKLMTEIPVRNIDGTSNVAGPISCFAKLGLKIGDHEEEKVAFMVTYLRSDDVIIGIDWLRYHNLEIDWNAGKFC